MAILALGIGFPVLPAQVRERGVHEHGAGTLEIAMEGQVVDIALRVPAMNVIGFEHSPRTAAEQAAVRAAQELFSHGESLFVFPEKLGCHQTSAKELPIAYEADGAEETAGMRPADFEVQYRDRCSQPEQQTSLEVEIFAHLLQMRQSRPAS